MKYIILTAVAVLFNFGPAKAQVIECDHLGCSDRTISAPAKRIGQTVAGGVQYIAHPPGCPRRAFCGCGAAVRLFGRPIRELWLARNWFKFPRAYAASGNVAVRRHHVFVLERHVEGNLWLVTDHNSGGHRSRLHVRSIAGYTIVNPRA